ncbi:ascorbate transporter, chloroplastic [Tanacetum coccineum]
MYPGKFCQPEQTTSYQRSEKLSSSSAQCVHRNMSSETLYSLNRIHDVSGYRNSTCSHGFDPLTGNGLRSRARGICRSFVSLPFENCNWIKLGVAMPAMNNILSKWIPVSERSRSLAMVYSGMYLGSVIGLAFSPILIQKFAWPSVFYSFGSLGSVAHSTPSEDPKISAEEKKHILGGSVSKEPVTAIPWKLILSKPPVWALIISHFCHNWGTFILLTWMPTYYNQVLKFNLTESGLLCVLPWLTMAVFANIGGWIADTLVSRGLSITTVRKGSDAFSQSGLYSNHQDIGPRYAVSTYSSSNIVLGLSNTAGVLAGVFGTAATGYILQIGGCTSELSRSGKLQFSWKEEALYLIHGGWGALGMTCSSGCPFLYIIGTLVWYIFALGEKILG